MFADFGILTKSIGDAHVKALRSRYPLYLIRLLIFPLASVPAFFYYRQQGKLSDHHTFEAP
jgi:hypothetical protein